MVAPIPHVIVVVSSSNSEPLGDHVRHILRGAIVPALIRGIVPLLKPAFILCPCQWLAWKVLSMRGSVGGSAVVSIARVDGLRGALAVAHDPRDVEIELDSQIAAPLDVVGIVSIPLIFDLCHDDGSTHAREIRLHHVGDELNEVAHVELPLDICAAKHDAGNPVEPHRQPAVIPFCADIGSDAHIEKHAILRGELKEVGDVAATRKIVLALLKLMVVPEDVDLQMVQSIVARLLQHRRPVAWRGAGIMEGAAEQDCALAVDDERALVESHVVRLPTEHVVSDKLRRNGLGGAHSRQAQQRAGHSKH
eukprot:m.696960 g.696960  ORF g.696960 m.696960 type:complete len:307 (-) comp58675_c0_seq3:1082-2002(-)